MVIIIKFEVMYSWMWNICGFILFFVPNSSSYSEQGKWDLSVNGLSGFHQEQSVIISKSAYKKTQYFITVICTPSKSEEFSVNITWYLRKAACWKEFYEGTQAESPKIIFEKLEDFGARLANQTSLYMTSSDVHVCDGSSHFLVSTDQVMKSHRDIEAETKEKRSDPVLPSDSAKNDTKKPSDTREDSSIEPFYNLPYDGVYELVLGSFVHNSNAPFNHLDVSYTLQISVSIRSSYGYLSAADYPLLVFYSMMCVVYVIYAIAWLFISFSRWRDMLRVQYWIGAVILLGMIEKAVFTAEFDSLNRNGKSVPGLLVFAELVSCAKRTLSRLLVIIVSFGFGIVKPRLGIVLNRIVVVGILYFFVASFEGCYRVLLPKNAEDQQSRKLLLAIIPLSVLETGICWWVFSALWSTTRTLQLRKNTIKLNLFSHFTRVLLFAVVSSVVFMMWSLRNLLYDVCVTQWKQLWVNDAFWHILFAIILLAIMILWRPTNNNQRFAFSPLLDEGSEEEESEKLMADVSDTMKLRSHRSNSNSSSPRNSRSIDDDLRWTEENIPSAATDTGIPIMDSDEEVLMEKFEISKMQ